MSDGRIARGSSWESRPSGCRVTLYGWTNDEERERTIEAGRGVARAALEAEPVASTHVIIDDATKRVVIEVRVTPDDVAAVRNGPLHRAAMSRASKAANRARELFSTDRWEETKREQRVRDADVATRALEVRAKHHPDSVLREDDPPFYVSTDDEEGDEP